jgi:aspartate--ammonia ligase
VRVIWRVHAGTEKHVRKRFLRLQDPQHPNLPEDLTFLHAEDILDMHPALPRKQRESAFLENYPAIFIGIAGP